MASFGAHKDKSPYLNVGKTLEAIMKLITIHESSFSAGPEVRTLKTVRALVRD